MNDPSPETDVLDKQSGADGNEPDPGQTVDLNDCPASSNRETHDGDKTKAKNKKN
jgi:hypothetical protein